MKISIPSLPEKAEPSYYQEVRDKDNLSKKI
jgi:hypothetical protein